MSTVKYYHLTEKGLEEGEALGRISVVLKADYDALKAESKCLAELDDQTIKQLGDRLRESQSELTKARELAVDLYEVAGALQGITTAATVFRSPTLRNNGRAYSWKDAQAAARIALERVAQIADHLAHQSAPAAKCDKCSDGGTCGLGGFCTNCHNLP